MFAVCNFDLFYMNVLCNSNLHIDFLLSLGTNFK